MLVLCTCQRWANPAGPSGGRLRCTESISRSGERTLGVAREAVCLCRGSARLYIAAAAAWQARHLPDAANRSVGREREREAEP